MSFALSALRNSSLPHASLPAKRNVPSLLLNHCRLCGSAVYQRHFQSLQKPLLESLETTKKGSALGLAPSFVLRTTSALCLRTFATSVLRPVRHWSDTLDDAPIHESPLGPGNGAPRPNHWEQEIIKYRLEQEAKYRKVRLLNVVYALIGCVSGYVIHHYWIRYRKTELFNVKWITSRKSDELRFVYKALIVVFFSVLCEMIEAVGSAGAYYPIVTLSCFLVGLAARGVVTIGEKYF